MKLVNFHVPIVINVYINTGFVMVTQTVQMDLMNHQMFVVSDVDIIMG